MAAVLTLPSMVTFDPQVLVLIFEQMMATNLLSVGGLVLGPLTPIVIVPLLELLARRRRGVIIIGGSLQGFAINPLVRVLLAFVQVMHIFCHGIHIFRGVRDVPWDIREQCTPRLGVQ